MSNTTSPLTAALRGLAAKGDPVRLFTTFGTFDGIAKVDSSNGNVTLHSYRLEGVGLRLDSADAIEESTGKYIVENSSPLMVAATAIQGVTAITSPRLNMW